MTKTKANFQNQAVTICNLEIQVGQMASILSERQRGNLPSTTKLNTKKHCNAITLRSGKGLEALLKSEKSEKEDKEVNSNKQRTP